MKLISLLSGLVAPLILSLDSQVSAQPASATGTAVLTDYGSIVFSAKWPSPSIGVCWENPSASTSWARSLVQRAVRETWQANSDIRFVGWGACTERSSGIHIAVEDTGPHVKQLGRYLDARPSGMVLNFSFRKWRKSCRSAIRQCIYSTAVHEFGHALAFTHEQNRGDAPNECKREQQGTQGDFLVTKFDMNSIMNYCKSDWIGNGRLSKLDIEAVQTVYGVPNAHSNESPTTTENLGNALGR